MRLLEIIQKVTEYCSFILSDTLAVFQFQMYIVGIFLALGTVDGETH